MLEDTPYYDDVFSYMTERAKGTSELIAAIDVGTNSFHMVIASVSARGALRIHARNKETVRLGSTAGDMKKLTADAIERGMATLKVFGNEAKQYKARIRAIATSAVREALNRDEFLEKVANKLGIDIEVVSGNEEGRLIYVGALHALPIIARKALVIDIGGGSTETVIGYQGECTYVHSEKLGHIRTTQAFFGDGNVTTNAVEECRRAIRSEWAPVFQSIIAFGYDVAVGCSGTINTIASMVLAKQRRRIPEIMNNQVVKRADVLEVIHDIVTAPSLEARKALPGMDSKRADVIVGGALILEQAILGLNIQELTISSYALREGIVFDTVKQKREIEEFHHLSHLRYQSVNHICESYRVRRKHAEHVKNLSLHLFDGLANLHKYGDKERELLEAAALLHDVGYHISADQHHKHSEYIIRNVSMPGFTNDETEVLANIARYHRKSHPKKKHESFGRLNSSEQQIVRTLAGMLRIAEGLDRRQQQVVHNLTVAVETDTIAVSVNAVGLVPDVELWSAERRKTLLENTLGKKVRLLVSTFP